MAKDIIYMRQKSPKTMKTKIVNIPVFVILENMYDAFY